MIHRNTLSIEELYDRYTEIYESLDGARTSLDELQIEISDEISALTTAMDDVRDELERCNQLMRRLSRRMNPVLSYMMDQEDNELPFLSGSESSGKHCAS